MYNWTVRWVWLILSQSVVSPLVGRFTGLLQHRHMRRRLSRSLGVYHTDLRPTLAPGHVWRTPMILGSGFTLGALVHSSETTRKLPRVQVVAPSDHVTTHLKSRVEKTRISGLSNSQTPQRHRFIQGVPLTNMVITSVIKRGMELRIHPQTSTLKRCFGMDK